MDRFDAAALVGWMTEVLEACGISPAHAALTADVLGRTSLRGIDTHGISRIPGYVERIVAGDVTTDEPRLDWRDGVLQVDGRNALGQVVATRAIDAAIDATATVALVSGVIRHSGHLSALGLYALRAAENGRVAIVCQRTPALMGLPGARAASIGNNPLAFAAPTGDGAPLVFDIASSVAARGYILEAARDNTPIPSSWALDPEGRPTTDPQLALRGFLQPMAGHKGIGIALVVETLTAGLGGWLDVDPPVGTSGSASDASAFVLVLNPDLFCGRAMFASGLRARLERLVAAGGAGARYPGQRQADSERQRRSAGIPIAPTLVEALRETGRSTGCPFEVTPLP